MIHAQWNQWVWDVLAIPPTDDERTIKRAYSKQLKTCRPEDDAEGFQKLRQAYDVALAIIQRNDEPAGEVVLIEADSPVEENSSSRLDKLPAPALEPVAFPLPFSKADEANALPEGKSAAETWEECLQSHLSSERKGLQYYVKEALEKITGRDEFLNLEFAHAFELEAAKYCAEQDADEELRDALVSFYGWDKECKHLDSPQRVLSHVVLGRYQADAMYRHLKTRGEAGIVLLEAEPPKHSRKLYNREFANELHQLLQQIRWQCPQVIWYRLNPEVVAWWEQQLAQPRIYPSTLGRTAVTGLVLSTIFFLFSIKVDTPITLPYVLTCYIAGQLACFSGLFVLQKYAAEVAILVSKLRTFRIATRTQLLWIPVYALLSTLLLLDFPNELANELLMSGMYAVLGFAIFANWEVIRLGWEIIKHSGIRSILAILYISFLVMKGIDISNQGLKYWTIYIPVILMLFRGGQYYYSLLDKKFERLFPSRVLWLLASAILFPVMTTHASSETCLVLSWLMTVSALFLASFYFRQFHLLAFISMISLLAITHALVSEITSQEPRIPAYWATMAIYMLINMATSKIEKRPFA